MRRGELPPAVLRFAKHCMLDWFGVALAGAREPVSRIVFEQLARADGGDEATLLGFGRRASLATAALMNGTSSHALDYDDTHWGMQGHPSAPVLGALLALAERERAGGAALLAAFVAGVEVECLLGRWLNPEHYARGFHATGTLGSFGAAAAAAHLLELDERAWQHAFGLAGTQAAGLKSGFGTMAKPFHAGRAAQSGLGAALLAAAGFEANPEILDDPQGFAATHGAPLAQPSSDPEGWLILDTLFKYHAACHLTHATIEGLRELMRTQALTPAAVSGIELRVDPSCLGVCNIERPETGLQAKFSLKATAALALLGDDTSDPSTFHDARATAADVVALMRRVQVRAQPMAATRSEVRVTRRDGVALSTVHDSGIPARDLADQQTRLRHKFERLCPLPTESTRALADRILSLEQLPNLDPLLELIGSPYP